MIVDIYTSYICIFITHSFFIGALLCSFFSSVLLLLSVPALEPVVLILFSFIYNIFWNDNHDLSFPILSCPI